MDRFNRGVAYLRSFLLALAFLGCNGGGDSPAFNPSAAGASNRYLYVASGSCYGGGVATAAGPSNTVARFDLNTGALVDVVIDYNQLAPGDSPVSIANYDNDHLLVLVENASGRRIDLVNKNTGEASTYIINSTALSAVLRSLTVLPDFSMLVSKSSAVEKFNSAKSRVLSGASPWVNAPAAPCATSTTLISSAVVDPISGKIVYTHAAATPNNKIGVISSTGYAAAADCLSGTASPTTLAMPTRALFHSSGKLLVSFGSTTTASNFIYSYTFNSSTGAISGATAAFTDNSIVNGPSSMAEDPSTGDVFVANVTSTFNTVERFHFSGNTMTRALTQPFLPYSVYTRCVADLKVMN